MATQEPAVACPRGDEPTGEIGALTHTARLRRLDVNDGHGVLTFVDTIENRTSSAASIDLKLSGNDSMSAIRSAWITEPGGARRAARLDDAEAASVLFEEYRYALQGGVEREHVVNSEERAAVLVHDSSHDDATVSVLVPCSVRSVTVEVTMLLPSVPVDGAWQFTIPGDPDQPSAEGLSDEERTALVHIEDSFVVESAAPIRAFLDDGSIAARVEQTMPELADDDEDGRHTITVRPMTGPKLRARGFALRVDPTGPPPPRPLTTIERELRGVEDAEQLEEAADSPLEPAAEPAAEPAPEHEPPALLARAELDLPRPLASAPAGLRVVFVVDNSVSVRDAGVAKALQIVDAILDEAPPDARYAIVTAGRVARVVVPPWQERDDRTRRPIALENGSDVLAALQKARSIAGDVDAGVEVPRIIAISDMQLRFVDDDNTVAAGFGGQGAPLTHLVNVADGDVEQSFLWSRSFGDDDPRARGPESTGGIWIDAGNEDESALFPHLIAPTRVDRPLVTVGGVSVLDPESLTEGDHVLVVRSPRDAPAWGEDAPRTLPELLHAGSGIRVEVALRADHAAFVSFMRGRREVHVGGQLWASPLDEAVHRDETLLGLLANDSIGGSLGDDVVRTIARRAKVVSRVTSLVEVPAFRPEKPELGVGLSGFGCSCCCGCGCRGLIGRSGTMARVGVDLKERETLEALLREDARACLVPRAIFDVEFGDEEILDVHEREGGTCVAERFWARRLDKTPREPGAFVSHREMTVGIDVARR